MTPIIPYQPNPIARRLSVRCPKCGHTWKTYRHREAKAIAKELLDMLRKQEGTQ